MKRLLVPFLFAVLAASPALATVPFTISYQGVLTDNAGNLVPDGNYNLTFNLYTVPVAGASIWTETQNNVPVSKGGFNVLLGSVTSLSSLFFDGQYYLGVAVNGGAELSPRIALASSPYTLGLALPFYCSTTPGQPLLRGLPFGGLGALLSSLSPAGSFNWSLEPDVDGSGGFLYVGRNASSAGFIVDGNTAGSGNASAAIYGSSSFIDFDTNQTGDASVQLPANAISAGEILDEPGIAQNHTNGLGTALAVSGGATSTDILAVTITTPAPGYIVVQGESQFQLFNPGVSADIQISETSGGSIDNNHYFRVGGASALSTGGVTTTVTQNWLPASIHRTFFKSAGTYTFYFQGVTSSGGPATVGTWNSTVTALYTPTAYGSVVTAPALAERAQFDRVTSTTSGSNGPGTRGGSGELVDLRELELKATRAKEAAERAERELLQAQLQKQLQLRKPAAAKKN